MGLVKSTHQCHLILWNGSELQTEFACGKQACAAELNTIAVSVFADISFEFNNYQKQIQKQSDVRVAKCHGSCGNIHVKKWLNVDKLCNFDGGITFLSVFSV